MKLICGNSKPDSSRQKNSPARARLQRAWISPHESAGLQRIWPRTESAGIEEIDDPVPADGEVLVDIKAAGINFPDILVIEGKYQVKTPLPFVPGTEASGVVSAIGNGVTRFGPGDRVIVTPMLGAFAEKCVAAESLCMRLPDCMTFEQGAGFTVTYATSYHAFRQCTELKPGETVLVLGAAGGVGSTAVEIAKASGAKVIAAASSEEKLAFARQAGADETINYSDTSLRDAVKSLTGNRGVDVVYDPVGGEIAQMAFRSLAAQRTLPCDRFCKR